MVPLRRRALLVPAASIALAAGPAAGADDVPALAVDDPRHVRAVYLDLLGRTPDEDELALAAGGRASLLVELLAGSEAFWRHWYEEELYYFLLLDNFRPDEPEGEASLPRRLADSELGVLEAVRTLVSGSAFHRANPGNDTFVSVVFEQLLGMTVQQSKAFLEAGKRMYDGERASLWGEEGRSQADVVAIACRRDAFAERFVARQYERVVGRSASRRLVTEDARRLRAGEADFPALAVEWVTSPDYAGRLVAGERRPKSDRQFVRGLYVDLTGRPPERETVQRYRTALASVADAGPLRSVIARVLLASEGAGLPPRGAIGAEALVDGTFRRFLGRAPTPDEREIFVTTYVQCETCPPDVVVAAVVTHPEYQTY